MPVTEVVDAENENTSQEAPISDDSDSASVGEPSESTNATTETKEQSVTDISATPTLPNLSLDTTAARTLVFCKKK